MGFILVSPNLIIRPFIGDCSRFPLTRSLPNQQQTEALQKLIHDLMWFSMVLGGFGKSWRRTDHRLFYNEEGYKKLIGCHWQWAGELDNKDALRVWNPKKIGEFINSVQETAKIWMQICGVKPDPDHHANWREVWHPPRVCVFGRIAISNDDCIAIDWLHQPYQKKISPTDKEKTIRGTSVTGKVSQIGCLWHRMYPPNVRLVAKNSEERPKLEKTKRFLELLTFFPDDSKESDDFLDFLKKKPDKFEQLWGDK